MAEVAGSIPGGVIGISDIILPAALFGVKSASNKNEHKEYLLWLKAAGV
jgi:hypothetical protein